MSQEGGAAGDEFRKMVIVGGDVEGEVGAHSSRNDFFLDSDGKSLKDSKKKHGINLLHDLERSTQTTWRTDNWE